MPKNLPSLGRLFFGLILAGALSGAPALAEVFFPNPFPIVDPVGMSPFWDWKSIETKHFRVSFPVELTEIAQRSAKYLEEAHATLSPLCEMKSSAFFSGWATPFRKDRR